MPNKFDNLKMAETDAIKKALNKQKYLMPNKNELTLVKKKDLLKTAIEILKKEDELYIYDESKDSFGVDGYITIKSIEAIANIIYIH